jgi:hypothetical protein
MAPAHVFTACPARDVEGNASNLSALLAEQCCCPTVCAKHPMVAQRR